MPSDVKDWLLFSISGFSFCPAVSAFCFPNFSFSPASGFRVENLILLKNLRLLSSVA